MSKAIKWYYAEALQPNKEKLLQNILGQIILLNEYLTDVITDSHKNLLTDAINTLYYIFPLYISI